MKHFYVEFQGLCECSHVLNSSGGWFVFYLIHHLELCNFANYRAGRGAPKERIFIPNKVQNKYRILVDLDFTLHKYSFLNSVKVAL